MILIINYFFSSEIVAAAAVAAASFCPRGIVNSIGSVISGCDIVTQKKHIFALNFQLFVKNCTINNPVNMFDLCCSLIINNFILILDVIYCM